MIKWSLILALAVSMLTACHSKKSGGGDTAGNGGDDVAMDFINASRKAAEIVALNPKLDDRVDVTQLRATIESMSVDPTDAALKLGQEEKTAVNYPSMNKIRVNRPRWQAIPALSKPAFALHECLGLMRIDDKNYVLSSQLLNVDPITLRPLSGETDILIVIDNSGSMEQYQNKLAEHAELLWNKIRERGLDFQIAVITSSEEDHGKFVGTTKVITPYTPNGLQVLQANIMVGNMGNGTEQFFGPVRDGLNPMQNPGFLRPTANLELIFLTDEEDQTPNFEPEAFAQYLWTVKGDSNKVFAYGIVPLSTTCAFNAPVRLTQFISLVKGDFHNICELSPVVPAAIGMQIVNHVTVSF